MRRPYALDAGRRQELVGGGSAATEKGGGNKYPKSNVREAVMTRGYGGK